jgi:hypothetical protein
MVDANPSCDLPRARLIERNRQRAFFRKQYAMAITQTKPSVSSEIIPSMFTSRETRVVFQTLLFLSDGEKGTSQRRRLRARLYWFDHNLDVEWTRLER